MGMLFESLSKILFVLVTIRSDAGADTKRTPEQNPSKDDPNDKSPCKTYKVELAEEFKTLKGTKPGDTEVFNESKAHGLVPVMIKTTFASPAAVNSDKRLPDSLTKVLTVLDQQNMSATGFEEQQNYPFLSGEVADLMSEGDKDDKKGDKDDKSADKDTGSLKEKPADSSQDQPASKLKSNKLLARAPQENMRLPASLKEAQDHDEPSESLLMA